MYRQGITKEKARKLLTDTGRYADIVYTRRFEHGANSLAPPTIINSNSSINN